MSQLLSVRFRNGILLLIIWLGGMVVVGQNGKWVSAGTPADNQQIYLPTLYKSGFTQISFDLVVDDLLADTIVVITHAGDERLFIGIQTGIIYVYHPDTEQASIFLDIRPLIVRSFEEGLLSLVFHPDYANNGLFFITYTQAETGKIILARYQVSSTDPNLADPNSEIQLLAIEKPPNPNGVTPPYSPVHNAGDMHFASDGFLYITIGDGGPDPFVDPLVPGDRHNNGQSLDRLLGKMLRIDVNQQAPHPADCGLGNYTIPDTNPFVYVQDREACDEIWSLGWRNPWRFTIDPLTGDLFIGDVGEFQREELDWEPAGTPGRNYGWHCYEGNFDHTNVEHVAPHCPEETVYTFPIHDYHRSNEIGCSSIIGGHVYRGQQFWNMRGYYLFSDFCTRTVYAMWTLDLGQPPFAVSVPTEGSPQWSTFGQDVHGELYVGGFNLGAIYKIVTP